MKNFIRENSGKLALVWAFVIFCLCATPGSYIPSVSWLEMLSFDKWVHAGVFFVLCSLISIHTQARKKSIQVLLVYVLLCIIYGGALEIMQAKVFSERSADWQDFIANSFGCLISLLLYKRWSKLFSLQ